MRLATFVPYFRRDYTTTVLRWLKFRGPCCLVIVLIYPYQKIMLFTNKLLSTNSKLLKVVILTTHQYHTLGNIGTINVIMGHGIAS